MTNEEQKRCEEKKEGLNLPWGIKRLEEIITNTADAKKRANLVSSLVDSDIQISLKLVKEAIGYFKTVEEFNYLGFNWVVLGLTRKVLPNEAIKTILSEPYIEVHGEDDAYRAAAEIALRHGRLDEGLEYAERAIKLYEEDEAPRLVAECARLIGDEDRNERFGNQFIDEYLEKGWFDHAYIQAKEMGISGRVEELYNLALTKLASNHQYDSCRKLALEHGDVDAAKMFFLQGVERCRVLGADVIGWAEVAEKSGWKEESKDLYAESAMFNACNGKMYTARDLANKAGLLQEARVYGAMAWSDLNSEQDPTYKAGQTTVIFFPGKADE